MSSRNFLSRHFPAPRFLDMPWVGIDISPLSVRMMEIVNHSKMRVGTYAEASLTTPFSLGEGRDAEVKKLLCKWKDEFNLRYVKASVPEEKAYLFDMEVELGKEEAMRSAIEFSLEENVPLSGSDVIFDYRLIGDPDQNGRVKVAVTVLPCEVVEGYLSLFHECGLVPISFLIEAQGLSRALIRREDAGTYLIVNTHSTRTGVFVVSRGAVQFTSTLSLGGLDFTAALQKQFSISEEEADAMKMKKGFVRTADNTVLEALALTASAFRQEVEKVAIYWNKHRVAKDPAEAIQKVLLCGREALVPGFKEYLAHMLNMPVEIGNVWSNLPLFGEYIPPLPLSSAINYGTAIGLALPENE